MFMRKIQKFINTVLDQDMNVTLLNFERACCLKDKRIYEVPGCDREALAREMRQVKYLISYMDSRLIETRIITTPQASTGEQQASYPFLHVVGYLNSLSNPDPGARPRRFCSLA
jgi:hypothetical protein